MGPRETCWTTVSDYRLDRQSPRRLAPVESLQLPLQHLQACRIVSRLDFSGSPSSKTSILSRPPSSWRLFATTEPGVSLPRTSFLRSTVPILTLGFLPDGIVSRRISSATLPCCTNFSLNQLLLGPSSVNIMAAPFHQVSAVPASIVAR